MNCRLNNLHIRRGRLLERISSQRVALGREVQPILSVVHTADRMLLGLRVSANYVKRHPVIAAFAAGVLLIKYRRVWLWTKRGFLAWRSLRALKDKLSASGFRARL
jgi:hypothetical protein